MPPITIVLTGQALLHGTVAPAAAGAALSDLLRGADAAIANLEATVECEGAWPTKAKTLHLTTPDAIVSLRDLGFTALTHANNHAFDLGPPGIARTREVVEGAGLQLAGSGRDRAEAAAPALLGPAGQRVAVISVDLGPQAEIVYAAGERAGVNPLRLLRQVTVSPPDFETLRRLADEIGDDRREAARAAVGYRTRPASEGGLEFFGTQVLAGAAVTSRFSPEPDDFAALGRAIEQARRAAGLVVVALHGHHWDGDWTQTPGWMLALSRALIDAGADLIAGTGAPVLQPIAFHRGKPILSGLGNVIFHTRRPQVYDRERVPVWTGAAVRCSFDSRGCAGVSIMPLGVGGPEEAGRPAFPPTPLAEADAARVFAFLTRNLPEEERALVRRL